jgi:hypothetical protein
MNVCMCVYLLVHICVADAVSMAKDGNVGVVHDVLHELVRTARNNQINVLLWMYVCVCVCVCVCVYRAE